VHRRRLNLPNALTIGRIAITPLVAGLPFAASWRLRLTAFVLFTVAGISDYVDGRLARSRQQETDFGKLLDPLADKLLLLGTFIPMYVLADAFPFTTPFGKVGLPLWVVVVVLGREAFMTVFRQAAARRGVVIAAIGPAKWKTGAQLVWQGSAYFWFWAATLAEARNWGAEPLWRDFAMFNGIVGFTMMTAAVILTMYSLVVYLRAFGAVFASGPRKPAAGRATHGP